MLNSAWVLIIGMLLLGKLCRHTGVFEHNSAAQVLNRYVIYIALPPLIINTLQNLKLDATLVWLAALPWLLALLSLLLVLLLHRFFSWSKGTLGTLILLCTLGNTAFLGYPAIVAIIGEHSLPLAVIYDQFGSFILLSTFGLYVAAYFDSSKTVNARTMLVAVVKFPPFIALLIGLCPIPWPMEALHVMKQIGASLVPVACFAVGLQWRLRLPRDIWAPFSVGLSIKMLVLPLVALVLAKQLQLSPLMTSVAVLQSGMPPMITAGAMAADAGLNKELAAAMVGFGVIIAMLSLPLLATLT